MKKGKILVAALIVTTLLVPILATAGECIYGWKELICASHSGRSTPGSCTTTPACPDWTTGGPVFYSYPCTSTDLTLQFCEEFTYEATFVQYSYVSGTQNCPTTCGTVWSPASISTYCTDQWYVYCIPGS